MASSHLPPVSSVSHLAKLFGIREDEPDRWIRSSKDEKNIDELTSAVWGLRKNYPILSEMLSIYLPSLLRLLGDVPRQSPVAGIILSLLCFGKHLPQSNRGLHRCPDARRLPSLLIERFVSFRLDGFDHLGPGASETLETRNLAQRVCDPLVLLRTLVRFLDKFGASSTCDLRLDQSLVAQLFQVGTRFLATPFLSDSNYDLRVFPDVEEGPAAAKSLKINIGFALTLFSNEGFFASVDFPSLSQEEMKALFECYKGSRVLLDTDRRELLLERSGTSDVKEEFWCEVGKEGCQEEEGGMKLCSKCQLVAYCSRKHQRADWKKHKLICFKPNW